MASLQITLDGTVLIEAGTHTCCSLSWSVVCSRHEQNGASLSVVGMVEREHGIYDHLYWLEDLPIAEGAVLHIVLSNAEGNSAVARLQTHEQLEAQRIEVNRAEAAGEYDAARAVVRSPVRRRCALGLATLSGTSLETAADSVTTVICSGDWSSAHRPGEWRLRLWSMPVEVAAKGFWQSIEGGAHVIVRDA